jgi:putative transposase
LVRSIVVVELDVLAQDPAQMPFVSHDHMIGTLRQVCLDHLIVINERHLRRVLDEYVEHYNAMRPHRSLGLDAPEGRPPTHHLPGARLRRRAVLGGLHHEYRWAA